MNTSWIESTKEKITNTFILCKRAISLAWQIMPGWTLINSSLVLLQGFLPLVSLYLMKLIVDSVTIGINSANKQFAFGHILFLIILSAGIASLTTLSSLASSFVSKIQSTIVSDHILDLLHIKSVEVDLEFYENPKYYDTLYRAQNDAPYRPALIINSLAQIGQSIISLLGVFWLVVSLSWIVAAALIITTVPTAIVQLIYADKTYNWYLVSTPKERKSWYIHWLLTCDLPAKEIRLFDLGDLFIKMYHNIKKELRNELLSITARQSVAELVAQIIGVVAIFGSFVFIVQRTLQGSITLGDMVMYFGALQQSNLFLSNFLKGFTQLYEDSLFMTTLFEFLDIKPVLNESKNPLIVPKAMKEGIFFEHVGFCYPGQVTRALDDINMQISPGQIIALVGNNGSGKTTLVKLLCRLYDPTDGKIKLDGTDLRDFGILDLRKEISVVFQDYMHYNLTAKENIWFGSVNTLADADNIMQAAEYSGADQVINHLENGYETVLGKSFLDGEELSIGEWQKIALSRAFFRNSQIVILDEPTSSLDPKAEEDVFEKFRQLAAGKTAIIISHRLSTVKMADCIYLMKDGRILENGNHEELMMLDGEYAKLFKIQAQHYN